jgi:hypothetical protein
VKGEHGVDPAKRGAERRTSPSGASVSAFNATVMVRSIQFHATGGACAMGR